MSPKDILASNFEILVTLDSVIESTGNTTQVLYCTVLYCTVLYCTILTTQARSSYLPNEILWGFR